MLVSDVPLHPCPLNIDARESWAQRRVGFADFRRGLTEDFSATFVLSLALRDQRSEFCQDAHLRDMLSVWEHSVEGDAHEHILCNGVCWLNCWAQCNIFCP